MTIWRWPAILVAVLSFVAICAADQSLPLADYKLRLDDYRSQIQNLAAHPESAADLYRAVPSAFQVQTPSGSFTVSMEFLQKSLADFLKSTPSAKSAILSSLSARVEDMRAEADGFEHARDGDPATRDRLNRILSAREFGRLRGPTELELLEERIRDWINQKLNHLFPTAPDLDQLGQIFVWITIAIVSSILAVWLYRRSRERLLDSPRHVLPFLPSAKSWRVWLAEARAKAALGEWREAIHLGFWAAVSRLENDGVWRPDKARTPREYLAAIPAENQSKSRFASLTRTFETAWYGGRPASSHDFERFLADLEELGCRG